METRVSRPSEYLPLNSKNDNFQNYFLSKCCQPLGKTVLLDAAGTPGGAGTIAKPEHCSSTSCWKGAKIKKTNIEEVLR